MEKDDLKIGDDVKLESSEGKPFTQKVESMQIEHAAIEIAKAGDEFGLKVGKSVKPKTPIIKVS